MVVQALPAHWNWPSSCWQGFLWVKKDMRPVTDEAILKAAKEIVVKFIEMGKITPANFEEHYQRVFQTIKESAKDLHNEQTA